MSLKDLNIGSEIEEDTLHQGRIFDTDMYPGTCKYARKFKTDRGATGIELNIEIGSRNLKETFYITDASGNSAPNGKTMAGLLKIDSFARVTTGKSITALTEDSVQLSVYDFSARKEVVGTHTVVRELCNVPVFLAVQHIIEDKEAKNAQGVWESTDEPRELNKIVKFFDAQARTAGEALNNAEPEFATKWSNQNKGVTWDRRKMSKGVEPGSTKPAGSAGGVTAPTSVSGSTSSMFATPGK